MAEVLEGIPLSPEQKAVLEVDARVPQSIEDMFNGITDYNDQSEFFKFARELVLVDGDFGIEEQEVLTRLQKNHLDSANIDDLVGQVNLSFDDDDAPATPEPTEKKRGVSALLRDLFLRDKALRS